MVVPSWFFKVWRCVMPTAHHSIITTFGGRTILAFRRIIQKKDHPGEGAEQVKRLSMDCKATVNIGAFSRGGQTRGDYKACDHDLGCKEKYIPCGIVDEDTGQLYVTFGGSFKTSDFIVDSLTAWWRGLRAQEQAGIDRVQIKMDNGSESSGMRTQFLHRM